MNSQGLDFGKLKSKTNIKKQCKLQGVFFPPKLQGGRFPRGVSPPLPALQQCAQPRRCRHALIAERVPVACSASMQGTFQFPGPACWHFPWDCSWGWDVLVFSSREV